LDWVGGRDAEPLGYYCDVTAVPRPRRGVNEKIATGLIRRFREWANMRDGARYDPPSVTLGAELYHKNLHCKLYRVHISEAVFERLAAEVREAGVREWINMRDGARHDSAVRAPDAQPAAPPEPQQPQSLPGDDQIPSPVQPEPDKGNGDDRDKAIVAALRDYGEPPKEIRWEKFSAVVQKACGYDPKKPPWGYGPKTIERRTRVIFAHRRNAEDI
jgi:hypothetical protein